MPEVLIATGQNITKDTIAGDRQMNRYLLTNGLMRPRRIGPDNQWTICGVDAAADPVSATYVAGAGGMTQGWYSYRAVYASAIYTRPVATLDGSSNMTRGNPSPGARAVNVLANNGATDVVVRGNGQAGMTHILIYRSNDATTQEASLAGPWFYAGQVLMNGTNPVTFRDTLRDTLLGILAEEDNFPPLAYRYTIDAYGYVFMGGNFVIGAGYTCTITAGSGTVVASGPAFYDGIIGWRFKIDEDVSGGTNQAGLYFANYVSPTELQLVDALGEPTTYDGSLAGAGRDFSCYLPGNVLRWSKYQEPEAFPTGNLVNLEGDIVGMAQLPNQSLILIFTDTPSIWSFDLVNIGTTVFITNKKLVSTSYSTSSHWSITPVESRLRAIDIPRKCVIETDGASARDITSGFIPAVWDFLDDNVDNIRLQHCAYDTTQHLFGAFVTFNGAQRIIDFSICQHTLTGGWFFHLEKDLLCTGYYVDPTTNELLVLGGTEGPGNGIGGVWGRIWTPNHYDEWIPLLTLREGLITRVLDSQTFEVDVSAGTTLATTPGGLAGRWVLVANASNEFAQLGYIVSSTANRIVINGVLGSRSAAQFNPPPEEGWRFYCGLIECKWGPKKFDFDDPDIPKKVWEYWCCVSGHNESNPPFIRLFRGFEETYDRQYALEETEYLDRTEAQSLVQRGVVRGLLTDVPRWGLMWLDRSYDRTILHSHTIVYNPTQAGGPQKK